MLCCKFMLSVTHVASIVTSPPLRSPVPPSLTLPIPALLSCPASPPPVDRAVGRCTKCPTCRSSCNHRDLTYVYDRLGGEGEGAVTGKRQMSSEEVEVKGSYSTKIVALVRGLIALPDGDKAIVFSEVGSPPMLPCCHVAMLPC